jgi:hypothetical protein
VLQKKKKMAMNADTDKRLGMKNMLTKCVLSCPLENKMSCRDKPRYYDDNSLSCRLFVPDVFGHCTFGRLSLIHTSTSVILIISTEHSFTALSLHLSMLITRF